MRTAKNLQRILLITLCVGWSAPAVRATAPEKPIRINYENLAKLSPADQARALEVAGRLEAISNMDRSALTRDERKALRVETRGLRREVNALNDLGGGTVIYISAATIIIILLVILLVT